MVNTQQASGALPRHPQAERSAEDHSVFREHVARPTVRRLFESWAEEMGVLCRLVHRGEISEGEFFALLEECRDRLKFYAATGKLAREVDGLTGLLASISDLPDGAGATTEKQEFSAPESGSGTEVATSNSNSNSKP
jgi:hypothetical protein